MNTYPRKLISLREVMKQTGLSRSTIYKYLNEHRFPKRILIGDRAVRWEKSEIQSWINSRMSLRLMLYAGLLAVTGGICY